MFSGLCCGFNCNGSEHSCFFGLNNAFLLRYSGSGGKRCVECGNLCHYLGIIIGFGNTLLLGFDDCLLFSLDDGLLLTDCFGLQHSRIEGIHFSLKCELIFGLFSSLLLGSEHCLLLGLNNRLLLSGSGSGSKSCIECGNLGGNTCVIIDLGKTSVLCLDDGLLLCLDNKCLFVIGLGILHSILESIHFGLETNLLFALLGGELFRSNHLTGLGIDDVLLLFEGICLDEGSVECGDLCHCSRGIGTLGNTLLFSSDNGLLLSLNDGSLFLVGLGALHSLLEGIHFSLKLELSIGGSSNLRLGNEHFCFFFINNSLLILYSAGSQERGVECGNLCLNMSEIIGFGNTLLFGFNDCLLLLFGNGLLLNIGRSCQHFGIQTIHFSLELFLSLGLNSFLLAGLEHCLLFGNDYGLLFLRSAGGGESSVECGNFSHDLIIASVGFGNALLLCLYNGLSLLFNNSLLLFGSGSGSVSGIEFIHFSLEFCLLCGLTDSRLKSLNLCGLRHSLLFGYDNSLLFFGRSCSVESSIECGNFCGKGIVASITAGNTLFLCLYNGLLLLFNNSFLLCRCLSGNESSVELVHFGFELCLLCGLSGARLYRLCHSLLFGYDNGLLFFGSSCGVEGGIERGNLGGKSGVTGITAGNALFLCFYNGLLLFFNNSFLLFGSSCGSISGIELVHFGLELSLLGSLGCTHLCGLCHSFLFGQDNSLLIFGGSCSCEGGIECGDLSGNCIKFCITGKALLLSLYDSLLLFFNNSFLLFGSLCGDQSGIKRIHLGLELSLLLGFCHRSFGCRTNHSLLFGTDQGIFCLRRLCGGISGVESSNLGVELVIFISSATSLLCFDDSLRFSFNNSFLLVFGLGGLKRRVQRVHLCLELSLLFGQRRSLLLGLEHGFLLGLDDSVLFLGSLSCCQSGVECKNLCLDSFGRRGLGHTLLLCLDNGLLLNVENSLLFVLGLRGFQSGIERVHIRLELHLICGLDVSLCGLEHCALFSLDDSLLFSGGLCSLHCCVELSNFGVNCSRGRGVGCENLLFCFDDGLLFFGRACCCKSGVERHDLSLDLCFSLFGSEGSASGLTVYNDACGIVCGSGLSKSLLLGNDLCVLFALDLSIDLGLGKSSLDILFFLGSLSGIHSHLEGQNIGIDLCQLGGTLVGLLLQLCSFLVSLLLFLDIQLHLLAAGSGICKAFTLIRIENLLGCHSCVVGKHRSHSVRVGIDNELVFVFFSKLGLNVDVDVHICRGFLIAVHQHVLNTADDVGGVVDQVSNDLYGSELFRRHGDHIHLALGGDGQKANGNYADTGSAATAKVFLSALFGFCGQIQATGGNTHRELGNRNNHHTARGNDLLTYNGVRINDRAHLV